MQAILASRRDRLLIGVVVLMALLLLAVLAVRLARETGGTNSYALVAESFLKATPWASACFDGDCAEHEGHTYVVFPPLPGLVAAPMVALFGIKTAGFIAIGALASALGLLFLASLLRRLGVDPALRPWILLAVAFASPLTYVTLRTEGVWFFAQALAFPMVVLALDRAVAGRFFAAGCALALALLCRQMSAFYAPLLLLLAIAPGEPLLSIGRRRICAAFALGLPIGAAVLCYLAYNYWRFGDPFEPGYRYIVFASSEGMLKLRWDEHGPWSLAYVPYNLFYLLFQGFHAEFEAPRQLRLVGLDNGGTSILAASPWLLFLFFTPLRRATIACAVLILGLSTALLFYHSNGFSQYNTQRYALDWLPAAIVMLAVGLRREHLPVFKLLVAWGIALNCVTVAILALLHPPG